MLLQSREESATPLQCGVYGVENVGSAMWVVQCGEYTVRVDNLRNTEGEFRWVGGVGSLAWRIKSTMCFTEGEREVNGAATDASPRRTISSEQ